MIESVNLKYSQKWRNREIFILLRWGVRVVGGREGGREGARVHRYSTMPTLFCDWLIKLPQT
jgi:hypothetical protein